MKTKSRTEQPDKSDNKIAGTLPWTEAVFQELADNIIDAVYCINTDGYFIFVNRAIIERSGISPDKFYASHFLDIVQPAYRDLTAQNFQRVMRGENGIPYELRYSNADGETRIIEVYSKPIRRGGKVVGLLGVARNIMDRKQAEEALKTSEQKYRILMENASDAILLADIQGNIVEANRKAEELWGYAKEELLQMHYAQLHPMPEMERTIAAFKRIIEKNTGHLSGGFIQRKDGDIVPIDITCNVIEYAGRKVVQGSFRDISEHKQAKDILEKLVKERTAELSRNNEQLKLEIKERKNAEAAMKRKSRELKHHTDRLRELNAALKVLLKQREDDKKDMEERFVLNMQNLVLPFVEQMKKGHLGAGQRAYLDIIEIHLHNIATPLLKNIRQFHLTPKEIKVAVLVKEDKSTKEIAEILGIATGSIDIHRKNIRKKLGLSNRKANLQSHLVSLEQ